ncbi:hypothetical protein N0V94_004166 [Neodidymelliopsis sp. IMI 364377]|nr:hypothetical protein N0V94_004166 [Neodidymelliopsis sp. IMI 364377]
MMQHQRRYRVAPGAKVKPRTPDRFTPILVDIRSKLGDDWTFYKECIDGIVDAATNQHDTTAWLEQMHQLVEGNDRVASSHSGILFLLQDMGIEVEGRHKWSEGGDGVVGTYPSPSLSALESSTENSARNDNVAFFQVQPHNMISPLPHRPYQPGTTFTAPAPHPPQQQQHGLIDSKFQVLPYDFRFANASELPALTFPKDLRAFHYPPEQVIMTEDYVPPAPDPLKKGSKDPVFFQDPNLKGNVVKHFTLTHQECKNDGSVDVRSKTSIHQMRDPALSYGPEHDDLRVYKEQSEGIKEDSVGDLRRTKHVFRGDFWPPWNVRFDLEL